MPKKWGNGAAYVELRPTDFGLSSDNPFLVIPQAVIADKSEAEVRQAYLKLVDGMPEGYVAVPYPKMIYHPEKPWMIVQNEIEHRDVYSRDNRWHEPPKDNLLNLFIEGLH